MRQQHAEIAVCLRFAAIDVFGDAAGKSQLLQSAPLRQRIEPQQGAPAGCGRSASHRREQAIRHPRSQGARALGRKLRANLEIDAELGAEAAASLLNAHDAANRVEAEQARADVEGGEIDHPAVGADRDFRRAAADVDIHDGRVVADRARHRARAVGRHHGLQTVAGRDRDHLASLARKEFADLAGVAPAHGDAGQDQRAGVDLVGIDLGVLVLLLDEGAELGRVDRLLALGRIGREQNVGLIERFARGHDIAAVQPLQHDA